MTRRRGALWLAALAIACHGPGTGHPVVPAPPPPGAPLVPFAGDPDAQPAAPAVPPRYAYAAGYMPLASSGVGLFHARHPTYDGRGVVIGILDSGIDPGVAGLQVTTTGAPKLLDLRDFSGEGKVILTPVIPSAAGRVTIAGHSLTGVGRIARVASAGAWYGGVLRESALGRLPAADLNGDGAAKDTFPIVVVRATDGWVAFVDANLDGSFDDETPLHDYRQGRQTIALGSRPLTLAANLDDAQGVPSLDFVFDDAGHGTHVAGVAAGHALFDIPEFDGVAPGAQLLGLKVTDNRRGGVSVTGSIARALAYAGRFAEERGLPLVLNLSFAIGTNHGELATIDSIVDAFLATHPGVVLAVAAGNEGPGLSTLGSPAAADLALSVGAALPLVFGGQLEEPEPRGEDVAAWWSARGGEVGKPDILAPGLAFSAVPPFATGAELKRGTSVAAPYAAGMAACLASAIAQEHRPVRAAEIMAALRASATPFAGTTSLDRGAGEPHLEAAYRWLRAGHQGSVYLVRVAGGGSAAFRRNGVGASADSIDLFRVRHLAGLRAAQFILRSSVPWLSAPATISAGSRETIIAVRTTPPVALAPGVYTGAVTARNPSDTLAGPLFSLVSTVVVPYDLATKPLSDAGRAVGAGRVQRYFLRVPGAGATVRATVMLPESLVSRTAVRLYEPSGQPFRGSDPEPLERSARGVTYVVRAEDLLPGVYELDVAAPPLSSIVASVRAQLAPFGLTDADGRLEIANPGPLTMMGTVRQMLVGAERDYAVAGRGAPAETLLVRVPAWAATATIDVDLPSPQWNALTGFGVTEFDSAGQQLAESPLNSAFGRQRLRLPASAAGRPLAVELSPAFARPEGAEPWRAKVRVRFLLPYERPLGSETQVAVVSGGRVALPVAPAPALTLPAGFAPLVEARVRAGVGAAVEAVRRFALPAGTR